MLPLFCCNIRFTDNCETGPIWLPVNVMVIRTLLNCHTYYGADFTVESPTGSARRMNLYQIADEISRRLSGIPPCAACHGPYEIKLGAPPLVGQQSAYIERQLAAFAQSMRQNDIDDRMRTIASQLTPLEMHRLAKFYAADVDAKSAEQ